jgi:competence protein ComEA
MRREDRGLMTAFLLLVVAIAAAVYLLLSNRPRQATLTVVPPQPTATLGPLMVYVTGAVLRPNQTVSVPRGGRVRDAVEAAGGATANADLSRVNLADLLRDGDQIFVPVVGEVVEAIPTPTGGDGLRINSATVEELTLLPGVGPVLAARIIEYRDDRGGLTELSELDAVSGIGPRLLEQLAPLIRFD